MNSSAMPAPRPTEVGASCGSPAQLAPFDAAQAEGVLFGEGAVIKNFPGSALPGRSASDQGKTK